MMTGRRTGSRRSIVVAALATALVVGPVAPSTVASAAATKPGKPKVLKVFVKGTGTLKAKWSTGKKATRYRVLVATNKKMTKGRKAYKVKGRAKTITGLRQGTTYYVKVRSYRGKKKSGWSVRKSARTLYATPGTPRISARGTGFSTATFTWTPATYATRYRVVITRGPGMAVLQRTPWQYSRAKALAGLRALPAGNFYYARVEANNAGKASRYSAPALVLLRPYSPQSPKVVSTAPGGLTVTWTRSTNAQRYELMARSRVTRAERITATNRLGEGIAAVNGLAAGQTHDLFVRAVTGGWRTGWVPAGSGVPKASRYSLRVGSYNVACANPGTRCSTVHPWLPRRGAVASTINADDYDVIGLQELSTADVYPQTPSKESQASTLTPLLPGLDFASGDAHRSGRWLFYNKARIEPVGAGGNWQIGYSASVRKRTWAVWQVFRRKGQAGTFAVVNAHLDPFVGSVGDGNRLAQTRELVSKAGSEPALRGIPVIYVGDMNSHEFRALDGPRAAFNAIGLLDGDDFAASRGRWWLNTANGWRNPNPRQAAHVDHVYVPRTIGVREFDVPANTSDTGTWRGRIPSDHNPARVVLDMP